ncbi:MAG: DapH/DapD/GlmU-related protein [Candidatus Omnitrophota bacterium]
MVSKVLSELKEWFESLLVRNVPGSIGMAIRGAYWRLQLAKCGSLAMGTGCIISAPGRIYIGNGGIFLRNCSLYAHNDGTIRIGDRVGVSTNAVLNAADGGEITINDDVLIGPNVVFRTSNHKYAAKEVPINRQGHAAGKIIVEEDVWIGANAVILPGVTIGRGSVVGAGAVVTASIPAYSLAGGVPARVIKENCRI